MSKYEISGETARKFIDAQDQLKTVTAQRDIAVELLSELSEMLVYTPFVTDIGEQAILDWRRQSIHSIAKKIPVLAKR